MLSGIFILKLWQYFKMSVRKESSQMSLNTKKCIIRYLTYTVTLCDQISGIISL
jgi:hypothetical protein